VPGVVQRHDGCDGIKGAQAPGMLGWLPDKARVSRGGRRRGLGSRLWAKTVPRASWLGLGARWRGNLATAPCPEA